MDTKLMQVNGNHHCSVTKMYQNIFIINIYLPIPLMYYLFNRLLNRVFAFFTSLCQVLTLVSDHGLSPNCLSFHCLSNGTYLNSWMDSCPFGFSQHHVLWKEWKFSDETVCSEAMETCVPQSFPSCPLCYNFTPINHRECKTVLTSSHRSKGVEPHRVALGQRDHWLPEVLMAQLKGSYQVLLRHDSVNLTYLQLVVDKQCCTFRAKLQASP